MKTRLSAIDANFPFGPLDWASLEKFERTRGVLRFMANAVGVLWQERTPDPLITPAVPVAHERVRASVVCPLDPAFGAVVGKEADGDGSLPLRMEANPSRAFPRPGPRGGRRGQCFSVPPRWWGSPMLG